MRHGLALFLPAGAAGFILLLAGGPAVAHRWRITAPLGAIATGLRRIFLRPAGAVIVLLSLAIHLMSVAIILLIAKKYL